MVALSGPGTPLPPERPEEFPDPNTLADSDSFADSSLHDKVEAQEALMSSRQEQS